MKELLKEWENFKKEQEINHKKVNARMMLWYQENPFTLGYYWNIVRKAEEASLEKQFDAVEITVENMLDRFQIK